MAATKPLRDLLPNSALEPLFQSLRKDPFRKIEIGKCRFIYFLDFGVDGNTICVS